MMEMDDDLSSGNASRPLGYRRCMRVTRIYPPVFDYTSESPPPPETQMKYVDSAKRMKQTLQGRSVLPPETRVARVVGGWLGVVQKFDCSVGGFPVRWDGGLWEICGIDDVTVVIQTPPRPRGRGRSSV